MRKISKFAAMAAIVALSATSCVKNEESDGVKSIREAQAKLISAEADKILAEVNQVLETVTGQKYDNQRKVWTLKQDSLAYELKRATDSTTIANLKRQAELAVVQQEIDMANRQASLESAKASLEYTLQTALLLQEQNATNQKNTVLVGYIGKLSSLLGTIQGLENQADAKDYDVAAAKNNVSNASQIITNQRNKSLEEIRLKYRNLELTSLLTAQRTLSSLVSDPSTLAADLAAAKTAYAAASASYDDASLALNKANEDLGQKDAARSNANSVYTQISTLVNTTLANITTYNTAITNNNTSLTSAKSGLAGNEVMLKTNQDNLAQWESKLPNLLSSYNSTNATFQAEQTNLAAKLTARDLAFSILQQENNTANQDAYTAANAAYSTALTSYNTANNAYIDAKTVYYGALAQVDNYKTQVASLNQTIANANNNISVYTATIADNTAKKAAAEGALAQYKTQQTSANAALEPAQTAYFAAQKVANEASQTKSYWSSKMSLEQTLLNQLRDLANATTNTNTTINGQIQTWEESVSTKRSQIEVIEAGIASINTTLANLAANKIKSDEDIKTLESQAAGLRTQISLYNVEMKRYQDLIAALQAELVAKKP